MVKIWNVPLLFFLGPKKIEHDFEKTEYDLGKDTGKSRQ